MEPIEIITIIVCVLIVGGVLGSYIYKKVKHKPTGCSGCSGCGCSSCSHCASCAELLKDKEEPKEENKANERHEDNS